MKFEFHVADVSKAPQALYDKIEFPLSKVIALLRVSRIFYSLSQIKFALLVYAQKSILVDCLTLITHWLGGDLHNHVLIKLSEKFSGDITHNATSPTFGAVC